MHATRFQPPAVSVDAHPVWEDENLWGPITGSLWYAGIVLVGASVGTVASLVYSLAG